MKLSLWLVGAGSMAQSYVKVLKRLKQPFVVIGRSKINSLSFKKVTGCEVKTGGLKYHLKNSKLPDAAIVAVGVNEMANVAKDLIKVGIKRILLEKPGALTLKEIRLLNLLAYQKKAKVVIGYNRRFYQSVKVAKKFIKKDEGVLSMNFEFTEPNNIIKSLKKNPRIKKHWLIANSSHVIDLAFHLCGNPKNWKHWKSGNINWHPASARFCGSGITNKGVMFSYFSDWNSPGRWRLELMTSKRRLIFRPLEMLKIVSYGNFNIETFRLKDKVDKDFKAGIFFQTKSFLNEDYSLFCSLSDQVKNMKFFYNIAGY
jgi:predicted dehydrogenase